MSELTDRINKLKPLLEIDEPSFENEPGKYIDWRFARMGLPRLTLELLEEHEAALGEIEELDDLIRGLCEERDNLRSERSSLRSDIESMGKSDWLAT